MALSISQATFFFTRTLSSVLLIILFSLSVTAQNKELEAIGRKYYVQTFNNRFIIWPVATQKNAAFIAQSSDLSRKLIFKPNYRYHYGIGAYIFGIGYQFQLSIPQSKSDIEKHGRSKSFNFSFSFKRRNWVLEAYLSGDRGFYQVDRNVIKTSREPDIPRPDIRRKTVGMSGIYFFNNGRFSMRAADNYYERQLKSAGSILLRAALNTFTLDADSVIYHQSYFGSGADFTRIHYTTAGLAPGYAHNFVIKKFFTVSASIAFGPALNLFRFSDGSGPWRSDTRLNTFSDIRFGAGYNSERFFAGISFSHQSTHINYDKTKFVNAADGIKLTAGYRFNERGVLKRRPLNFLQPKSH